MKTFVSVLLSLMLLTPVAASARPYHITSVRWIVNTRNNMDVDDRYVTLIGHVTRRIGDSEYWFADPTGQVRLDSENFDLPLGRTIVLGGRIDQAYLGIGHLEVDVRNWHYYAPLHRPPPVVAPHGTITTTTRTVVTPAPVTIPAPNPVMTPPAAPASPTLAPPTDIAPAPASTNSPSGPVTQ